MSSGFVKRLLEFRACKTSPETPKPVGMPPAGHTVLGKIPGNPCLGDAEMVTEKLFQIGIAAASGAGTRKSADGDPQRVARFYVVVGSHVVVSEDENARTSGSVFRVIKFCG